MRINNAYEEIEFNIISYEFPDAKPESVGFYDYDANWLKIEILRKIGTTTRRYYDNCILTYELLQLIAGLKKLANSSVTEYRSDFMEPYLDISVIKIMSKIIFTLIFDIYPDQNKTLDFSTVLTYEDLLIIIIDLESQAVKFPERK